MKGKAMKKLSGSLVSGSLFCIVSFCLLFVGCGSGSQCGEPGLDCPSGQVCVKGAQGGVCTTPCTQDSDCQGDDIVCHPKLGDSGACAPECKVDANCGQGNVCNNNRCESATTGTDCKADRDCPGSQTCSSGKCAGADLVCTDSRDCPAQHDCVSGKCVRGGVKACSKNSDCDLGYQCKDSVCAEGCATNKDCPAGKDCIDNKCSGGTAKACSVNSDCSVGQICKDSACVAGCMTSKDCANGQTCQNGQCSGSVDPCAEITCPSGQTCQNGVCTGGVGTECQVTVTQVSAGWQITLQGLDGMNYSYIRCEYKGSSVKENMSREGASQSLANGNTVVCPTDLPLFLPVRATDWPKLPACKITGARRVTGVDPKNLGAEWLLPNAVAK